MDSLKADLHGLLQSAVAPETVIYADQNAPRPALPYWTMRLHTQRMLGRDAYSQGVTADGDQTVTGVREATLQVQRFGPDSELHVTSLRDNLSRTTIREQWQLKDIALYDLGDVLNVPVVRDEAQFEPRAALDLFVRFGTQLLDRVGIIETVGTNAGFDGNPDLATVITVVL